MAGFDNEVMFAPGVRLEPTSAQSITLMQDGTTTNVSRINYTGDPNGVVSANPSSLSHDPVSGDIWQKVSGTGTTVWQLISSGAGIETLTGNDGIVVSPDGVGNIDIVTANTTTEFLGTANTLTVDYNLNNLVLGSSLPSLSTGSNNAGLGALVLDNLTSATDCAAFGYNALKSVNSGDSNSAFGSGAGTALTIGRFNNCFGRNSLLACTSGERNVAVGFGSLGNANASDNISCGYLSTLNLTSGSFNIAIGTTSLFSGNGSNNIALGHSSALNYTSTESSNICIGSAGVVADQNAIRIGTDGSGSAQQNKAFVAGITGVTVAASAPVAVSSTGQLSSLGFGTATQVLTSNGAGVSPSWAPVSASSGIVSIDVDAATAPGTDPTLPNGSGVIGISGASVAAHSVPVETRARAVNSFNVEVQESTTAAGIDTTKNGLAHFNSSDFTVTQGFVSLSGSAAIITSGNFTPTMTFGGGNTGMSLTLVTGTYYKIGPVVFYDFSFDVASKGSSTGTCVMNGLPFGVNVHTDGVLNISLANIPAGGYNIYNILPGSSLTQLNPTYVNTGSPTNGGVALDDSYFNNGTHVRAWGTYFS